MLGKNQEQMSRAERGMGECSRMLGFSIIMQQINTGEVTAPNTLVPADGDKSSEKFPLSKKSSMRKSASISRAPSSQSLKQQCEKIHAVIDGLNTKLTDVFHRRESDVLEEYRAELIDLQNQLTKLKLSTNEEGLKQRLADKKEQLGKERAQLLELSMFFSGKCEVFKQKLAKVVHVNNDLEADIRYLRQNMTKPLKRTHKVLSSSVVEDSQVQRQLSKNKLPKMNEFQQKPLQQKALSPENKVNQSMSAVQNPSVLNVTPPKRKPKLDKLTDVLHDPVFKPTEFEVLFSDSVQAIKSKKLVKSRNLPTLRKVQQTNPPTTAKVSDNDLTDFDKRNIIQDFLSRDETKDYLYKILFLSQEPARKGQPDIFQGQFSLN